MKFILPLVCGVIFLQNFAFGRLDLNDDAVVGVNQKNLEEYMRKAINGFKKIILKGDEGLDYPVMEPYKAPGFSWEYADTSDSKNYKLNLFSKGETIIKGLSDYRIARIMEVNAKDMSVSFTLQFSDLEIQCPYKLDGYLHKHIMPIYGEGLIKLFGNSQRFYVLVDLGIEKGNIVVELYGHLGFDPKKFAGRGSFVYKLGKVKVTGLMDLSEKFASYVIDGILGPLVEKHANKVLSKLARDVVEEAVSGMTADELFDLLDYFVKKNDEKEN